MRIYESRKALLEAKADQQRLIDHVGQELADEFFAKKKLFKSPENDIYYWLKKEPQELVNFLSQPITKKQREKSELEQILAMPEANDVDLVSEQDGYTIYKINSPEASVKYGLVVGGRAKWCISGGYTDHTETDVEGNGILAEAKQYFYHYLQNYYEAYFFVIGHGTKYALCIRSYDPLEYDIYDKDDKRLDGRNSQVNIPYLTDVYYNGDLIYEPTPEFEIKNGVLIKYNGEGDKVVIPDDVREIGDYAFYKCKLTSIEMPKVQVICKCAFYNCYSLTSVEMPNVEEIGDGAFISCSLTSVEMPQVQTIGDSAFEKCTSLTDIDINPKAKIGADAFRGTPIEQQIKDRFGLTERFNNHSKLRKKPMKENKMYSDVIPYNKSMRIKNRITSLPHGHKMLRESNIPFSTISTLNTIKDLFDTGYYSYAEVIKKAVKIKGLYAVKVAVATIINSLVVFANYPIVGTTEWARSITDDVLSEEETRSLTFRTKSLWSSATAWGTFADVLMYSNEMYERFNRKTRKRGSHFKEAIEWIDNTKTFLFHDYYKAKDFAKKQGLIESEYGDVYGAIQRFGEPISYGMWNKSGDSFEQDDVRVYYVFRNGKPAPLPLEYAEDFSFMGISVEDFDDKEDFEYSDSYTSLYSDGFDEEDDEDYDESYKRSRKRRRR